VKNYKQITNQLELDALLEGMLRFHDSCVKELHAICGSSCDAAGASGGGPMNLRVLLQHCNHNRAPQELVFRAVRRFSYDRGYYRDGDFDEDTTATGEYFIEHLPTHAEPFHSLQVDFGEGHLIIQAEQLFYREHPSWFGACARFAGEIPSPEMTSALPLDGDWRQCNECGEAWQQSNEKEFSYCPKCDLLTELELASAKEKQDTKGE